MKRKTVKKRSLIFAIAMLLISAITLTSSTFAWFSMGPRAEVQAMDLTVSSPDGIQISANATQWDSLLTVNELFDRLPLGSDDLQARAAYSGNHNIYPATLNPVSSAFNGADGNGYSNFYDVVIGGTRGSATLINQAVATDEETSQQVGFVAFDLFLKSAKTQTVYFDQSTFTNKEGSDDLKATTALRIAFQNMGNVALNASAQQAIAISGLGSTTMYEPNAEERSDDSANLGGNSAGIQTTQYVTAAATSVAANANQKILTESVGATQATAINNTAADNTKTFEVQAGITKLRVYIWVEGNDIDCRDSIGTDEMTATLIFNTVAPGDPNRM